MGSASQDVLRLRDDSFDLALAVMQFDTALRTTPAPANLPLLQLQVRDLARRVLTKIARACVGN